jgi:hypothetical protein
VRIALVPLVISLIVALLWVHKVYRMTGRFVLINYANSQNLFYGNNPYTPLYKTWWFGSHSRGEMDVPTDYSDLFDSIQTKPREARDRFYWRYALGHIASRPDLFLLRTANRIRSYFAFDTYTGSYLLNKYRMNRWFSLITMGVDAVFYCLIAAGAILFLFTSGGSGANRQLIEVLLGTTLVYAFPYWISFSHPTYHFPVVPLLAVLACAEAMNRVEKRQSAETKPSRLSATRRIGAAVALLTLLYIQIEWFVVMRVCV